MAFLIVFEGIDGSGKGTQAARLCDRLGRSDIKAELISFPRYDRTLFGKAIGEFLNGRFGTLDEVHPFLASLLYAGDRFESREMLLSAIKQNDVVVLDRYVPSNVAHQGAKLEGADRGELVERILKIEHEIYNLPRPDLVMLLDLPALAAQTLIAKKQARDYTDRKADIQEADGTYLERVREVYLQLAESEHGWHKIDSMSDQSIRPMDEIAEEIGAVVAGRMRG